MDMYKEEMECFGGGSYSGLQKIFPDEKDLTLTERLEAARGPLLSWYRGNKGDLLAGEPGCLPDLDLGDHAAADESGGGKALLCPVYGVFSDGAGIG